MYQDLLKVARAGVVTLNLNLLMCERLEPLDKAASLVTPWQGPHHLLCEFQVE